MDNNLENMVEVGTEVVDEVANDNALGKIAKYVVIGGIGFAASFVVVKYVIIPGVRKIKEKCGKKKDILDLEEFEG